MNWLIWISEDPRKWLRSVAFTATRTGGIACHLAHTPWEGDYRRISASGEGDTNGEAFATALDKVRGEIAETMPSPEDAADIPMVRAS